MYQSFRVTRYNVTQYILKPLKMKKYATPK